MAGEAGWGESRAKGLGVFGEAFDLELARLYSFALGKFDMTYWTSLLKQLSTICSMRNKQKIKIGRG